LRFNILRAILSVDIVHKITGSKVCLFVHCIGF
jgi:hypothetical protein